MEFSEHFMEQFVALACRLSRRALRAHLRWRVTGFANDNGPSPRAA